MRYVTVSCQLKFITLYDLNDLQFCCLYDVVVHRILIEYDNTNVLDAR